MPWARHPGGQVHGISLAAVVLQSPAMPVTKRVGYKEAQFLLRKHLLHAGLYARVARKTGFNASYISRVAKGERTSEKVLNALVAELRRIEQI
jgi:hypothetical protein